MGTCLAVQLVAFDRSGTSRSRDEDAGGWARSGGTRRSTRDSQSRRQPCVRGPELHAIESAPARTGHEQAARQPRGQTWASQSSRRVGDQCTEQFSAVIDGRSSSDRDRELPEPSRPSDRTDEQNALSGRCTEAGLTAGFAEGVGLLTGCGSRRRGAGWTFVDIAKQTVRLSKRPTRIVLTRQRRASTVGRDARRRLRRHRERAPVLAGFRGGVEIVGSVYGEDRTRSCARSRPMIFAVVPPRADSRSSA